MVFFFFSLPWFSESGKRASERILKTDIRLFRCGEVAFFSKWQMKMKCAYSGSLSELNFLAIYSRCQFTMPGLAQCGHSALCSQRTCDWGSVCPKWTPIPVKNRSFQCHMQKSHCHSPNYRCPWSQWQHCPAEKTFTIESPMGKGIWARIVSNYQPVLQVPKTRMTSDLERTSDLDCWEMESRSHVCGNLFSEVSGLKRKIIIITMIRIPFYWAPTIH